MLGNIPYEFTRRFVFEALDFSSWTHIEPYFQRLLIRGLDSGEDLALWLLDRSELLDLINEEGALRYIRMTTNTESEELQQAYYFYLEEILEELIRARGGLVI